MRSRVACYQARYRSWGPTHCVAMKLAWTIAPTNATCGSDSAPTPAFGALEARASAPDDAVLQLATR